ncbi:MAG: GNAT family N-acetyltransferase [Cyanobium sp. NAT70]|nr:GNAT family N-acetyltransferase [Cyanobium sp. NAT70]|tara:strand:+ start:151 stop:1107 length:957 start_codon:yes stop_codon:yes gene_type:complete
MTLPGSSIPQEVALPAALVEAKLSGGRLFSIEGLELFLLPGRDFAAVDDAVGRLREATYRQQLSGSGDSRDLDGRDAHYDHLLLVEKSSGALAGAARLQFIPGGTATDELPGSDGSYLEHVYPGIKATLTQLGHHLEIGRVTLSARFQRQPHSLMALFRGGLLIAARSGYGSLHGLVSYNHFAHPEAVNQAFLSALMRPPYRQSSPELPPPRHPVESISPSDLPNPVANVQALELSIRNDLSDNFRLPVLLRQYFNLMEARVCDLSLARDFNQITEILMAADLSRLPDERLRYFIDVEHEPIYQQFSWYRGEASADLH